MLSKAVVDAKGKEYTWHLATMTVQLVALNNQEEALENAMDTVKNNLNESIQQPEEINDEQPAIATGYLFSTSTQGIWLL